MKINRRSFIKVSSLTSVGLTLDTSFKASDESLSNDKFDNDRLLSLSYDLLRDWCQGMLSLQLNKSDFKEMNGGIVCPACARVHGRIMDAVYPLMYMADETGNSEYLESALKIFDWTENYVSFPDGRWVNDVNINMWDGTTVFGAIALAETLMNHGHLLGSKTYASWKTRLVHAVEYLYELLHINFGNINYPVAGSYAFALIGNFLDEKKYTDKGRKLARESLEWFTPKNSFLHGEGRTKSSDAPKDVYHVDLGYNVEESLPALVLYSKLMDDKEILEWVVQSLKTHAEFMLPDGAWDNSWGNRNFKWTYWGSRTSDGCQPAYALLSKQNPEFYKIALLNTKLLSKCTSKKLLYGGPHYTHHDILPCVHHTFTHCKALTTILHHHDETVEPVNLEKITIPREMEYGAKEFPEIKTWLVSKGGWRATVTGYDVRYRNVLSGHVSGGALSMLWHQTVGPVLSASMVRYKMVESMNMQMEKDDSFGPLTPRFEITIDDVLYTNLYDFNAIIAISESEDKTSVKVSSNLVDENQNDPQGETIRCDFEYVFAKDKFILKASHNGKQNVTYSLPVIAASNEKFEMKDKKQALIHKRDALVSVISNSILQTSNATHERMFNYVPGLQAIMFEINDKNINIKITIT